MVGLRAHETLDVLTRYHLSTRIHNVFRIVVQGWSLREITEYITWALLDHLYDPNLECEVSEEKRLLFADYLFDILQMLQKDKSVKTNRELRNTIKHLNQEVLLS